MTLQPDVIEGAATDSVDDLIAHYAHKADIVRASIEGTPIQALCGKWWIPSRNPDGLAVCQPCRAAYERFDTRGLN